MDSSYHVGLLVSPPPPGVTPNFDHPQSRTIQAHIVMGVCIGIAAIFVILRIYIKLAVIAHMWGWDDWACLTGFVFIIAYNAVAFVLMKPGGWLGVHSWDIRTTSYTKGYFQLTLAAINLFAASALFVRISLFLLYLRLFKPNKTTRRLVYGGMSACGLFYCASIISNCALCMPRPGQQSDTATWLLNFEKCGHSTEYLALCQGVFGTLSDVYLLVIPIQLVFQLHLPVKRKLGVSAIFLVGIIAITCSIAGLGYRAKLLSITDTTWYGLSIYIFSTVESSAGIVCSCMPILPALFRGCTSKKYRFPSLRYFSFRFSSRPYLLNDTHSLNNLQPGKRHSFSGHEIDGRLSLEGGIVLVEPKQAVTNSKGSSDTGELGWLATR